MLNSFILMFILLFILVISLMCEIRLQTISKKYDYSFIKNKKEKYDAEFFINEKNEFIILLNGYFKNPLEKFFISYFEENKYMSISDTIFNNKSTLCCGFTGKLLTKNIKYKKVKLYDLKRIGGDDIAFQNTKVLENLGNGYMRESKAIFRFYEK